MSMTCVTYTHTHKHTHTHTHTHTPTHTHTHKKFRYRGLHTERLRIKVNILRGKGIDHCEKKIHTDMCLILTVTDIGLFESLDLTVTFVWGGGLGEGQGLQNKGRHTRRIAGCILDAAAVHIKKREDHTIFAQVH
jgi:predicted TIM-barrel fold metal-dependent hydrolase